MRSRLARGAVPLGVLCALLGGFVLAQWGYSRTDWAVAASSPSSPILAWSACLRAKPEWAGAARPGIDPGSRLYYHPRVVESASDRSLVGWRFYGSWRVPGGSEGFSCVTSVTGSEVAWSSLE